MGSSNDQERGGKIFSMAPPDSQYARKFDGTGATDMIEWYEKFAEGSQMSNKLKHQLFQYYCTDDIQPIVAAIERSTQKEAYPWEALKTTVLEQWQSLDTRQTTDPLEALEMWFSYPITADTDSVRKAIGRFEAFLRDSEKDINTTEYTYRFFRHLPKELQTRYLDRTSAGLMDVKKVPFAKMRTVINNLLQELEEREGEGMNAYEARLKAPNHRRPQQTIVLDRSAIVEHSPKVPKVNLSMDNQVEQLREEMEKMRIQLGRMSEPQRERYQARVHLPSDQTQTTTRTQLQQLANAYDEAYEVLRASRAPEIGDVQEDLTTNYQSGPRGGYRRSDNNGVCRYDGGRHMIAECKAFLEDVSEGICHYDAEEKKFYMGKPTEQTRRPLAALFVLKFRDTGELRNLVWSYHERYPDAPSNAGIKRQKARGVVVTTGTRFLSYTDSINEKIRPTTGLARERTGPGIPLPLDEEGQGGAVTERVGVNFARVYEGERPLISYDSAVEQRFKQQVKSYSHTAEDQDGGVDIMAQKRGLAESQEKAPTASDQTAPIAKRTRTAGPEQKVPEPTREAPKDIRALDNDAVNELIEALASRVLESKITVTPLDLFALNPAYTAVLVARIQNARDKVATTIYLDGHGKTTKAPKNNKEYRTSAAIVEIGDEGELEIRGDYEAGESLRTNFIRVGQEPTRVGALPRLACSIGPQMGEHCTKAILDSGSEINSMSYAFAERAGVALMPSAATSRSYHGTTVTFKGEVKEKIWVGGHCIYLHFFVMPPDQPCEDVLLGIPFVRDSQMCFEHHPVTGNIRANMIFGNVRLVVPVHDAGRSRHSDQTGN